MTAKIWAGSFLAELKLGLGGHLKVSQASLQPQAGLVLLSGSSGVRPGPQITQPQRHPPALLLPSRQLLLNFGQLCPSLVLFLCRIPEPPLQHQPPLEMPASPPSPHPTSPSCGGHNCSCRGQGLTLQSHQTTSGASREPSNPVTYLLGGGLSSSETQMPWGQRRETWVSRTLRQSPA